jgi:penicillin-binding protein 1A
LVDLIFRSKKAIGKVSKASARSVGAAYQIKKNRRKKIGLFIKKSTFFLSILGLLGVFFLGIVLFNISKSLPEVDSIATYIPAETTKIYAHDGYILAELHKEENRILIPIENISDTLKQAVIAMEDTDFYKHRGINIKGIIRALIVDIKARKMVQGASTLTQQLARNLFLHKQKKIVRKLAEIILAIQIERKYTKTEIFEMYLNQVYWGHNAYGIESATLLYFGKHAKDLNLAESAILVGILKGPELYSPLKNFARAKQRQKTVLTRMVKLKLLLPKEAEAAYDQELVLVDRKKHKYKAPYFTSYIVEKLIELYGEESTYTAGMKVYTTLNYDLQLKAKEVVKEALMLGNRAYWIKGEKIPSLNYTQAALLAIDPRTGYILAMQGGADFQENEFNRTTQAKRQPGSTFKPFVYLTALQKGFSPGTFIEDSPVTFNTIEGPYAPQNYNMNFLGKLPMRKALEQSVNVVAIKLNDMVGPENVVKTARQMGISSPLAPILSLPLGANEVTMLEMASVYGVLANGGVRVEPTGILKIEDRDGIPLYKHKIREEKVFDKNLIAVLVNMMKGVVNYGTGRGAKLPRPIAGKTGTTSSHKDAWFMGIVPQMVCATWVGNDDNTPMNNVTGGWFPAIMWKNFMREALKNIPPQDFTRPKGLVARSVNWQTGNLASEYSDPEFVTTELYWKGSEPIQEDTPEILRQLKEQKRKKEKEENNILDFFNMN